MTTIAFFALFSGIFWAITYLLILHRSIQDRVIGMPMVALCLNIAWEFIFSFVYPSHIGTARKRTSTTPQTVGSSVSTQSAC